MAVFRIERTRDYTVMSNHHLRNGKLSLKGAGTHRVCCCQKHTDFGAGYPKTPGATPQYRQETKTA